MTLANRLKVGVIGLAATMAMLGGSGLATASPTGAGNPNKGDRTVHDVAYPLASDVAAAALLDARIALVAGKPGAGVRQPPPVSGAQVNDEASVQAGYQWFPGRNGGTAGVRIRTSAPSGTVVGLLPRYAHLWIWCSTTASNGTWWYRIAYNPGNRWIYGYSSAHYVYPSPDRWIPAC